MTEMTWNRTSHHGNITTTSRDQVRQDNSHAGDNLRCGFHHGSRMPSASTISSFTCSTTAICDLYSPPSYLLLLPLAIFHSKYRCGSCIFTFLFSGPLLTTRSGISRCSSAVATPTAAHDPLLGDGSGTLKDNLNGHTLTADTDTLMSYLDGTASWVASLHPELERGKSFYDAGMTAVVYLCLFYDLQRRQC